MLRLIVVLLFLAPNLWAQYVPLTDAEAKAYVLKVGPDEIAKEIQKLDLIEHSTPVFSIPEIVLILQKSGQVDVAWTDPGKFHVSVAQDALVYDFPLKPVKSHLKIKDTTGSLILSVLGGTAISAAGGWTLQKSEPQYAIPISAVAGALTSWLIWGILQ